MYLCTIKGASRLTGLDTHRLRVWEKRHGAVHPRRDVRGRRLYSPEDIARLRKLAEAVDLGFSIGKVAQKSNEQLTELTSAESPPASSKQAGELAAQFLAAVSNRQAAECDELLEIAVICLSPAEFVEQFLHPVMKSVGESWASGELTVGQEHAVSAAFQRTLLYYSHRLQRAQVGSALVFTTLSGERHELGALGAAYVGSAHGLRVMYLGPDLPPLEIANEAKKIGAAAVAVSIKFAQQNDFAPQLKELRARLPVDVEIWLGGGGIPTASEFKPPANCRVFRSMEAFEQTLDLLHPGRSLPRKY